MTAANPELMTPQLVLIATSRKILIWIDPRPGHELLSLLDWQRRHYPDSAPERCPYCQKSWLHPGHAPAGVADCLHVEDSRHWWTADLCCKSCLASPDLLHMIDLYLNQCSGLQLIPADPDAGVLGAELPEAPAVLH